MFNLSIGVGEIMLRALLVYAFLFLLLRFGGKKHVGELAPFDLVVLLGLIAAATLVGIVHVVGYASWRNKAVERVFEGKQRILVRHGHVLRDVLAQERVTHSELIEALRREGCTSLTSVRFAVLENDGSITVGLRYARD